MRLARRERIDDCGHGGVGRPSSNRAVGCDAIAGQKRRQCQRTDTKLALLQKMTTRQMLHALQLRMHGYLFINISSRFSSTLETTVHAANSARFALSGAAPIGSVAIFFAAAS